MFSVQTYDGTKDHVFDVFNEWAICSDLIYGAFIGVSEYSHFYTLHLIDSLNNVQINTFLNSNLYTENGRL